MKRVVLWAMLCLLINGCSTVQEINRADGSHEYIIACGAATGWDICYAKANEICPNGYQDIKKLAGFNRKELRILCK